MEGRNIAKYILILHADDAGSHMMRELQIASLQEVVDQWAKEKEILNHVARYSFPPNIQKLAGKELSLLRFLRQIPQLNIKDMLEETKTY